MEFFSVYGASVATFDLDYDEDLLTNTIKEWKKIPAGEDSVHGKSVKEGFTSYERNVNFLKNSKLTKLKQDLEKCGDLYTEKVNLNKVIITNSWFTMLYQDGEVQFHRHGDADLAGAFYFNIGKESAPLVFDEEINEPSFKLFPKNGRVIIFPGWMRHGVEVNKSLERGTISFNMLNINMAKFFTRCNHDPYRGSGRVLFFGR